MTLACSGRTSFFPTNVPSLITIDLSTSHTASLTMAPIAIDPVVVDTPVPTAKVAPSIVQKGTAMDLVSDMVDEVNVYRGTHPDAPQPVTSEDEAWRTEGSQFDSEKDKADFRRYEDALDHVKAFYKTQHEKQPLHSTLKHGNVSLRTIMPA